MLLARSHVEISRVRSGVARISRLSDNIIGFGPFGIGLDGVLAWIPGIGDIYSVAAGGLLLLLGVRARAPIATLLGAAALIAFRSAVDVIPIVGPAVVDLFRGHKMAADMLLKAIDRTLYVEGPADSSNPNHAAIQERVRSRAERRRVVFLG
jgi:hypothetical protein